MWIVKWVCDLTESIGSKWYDRNFRDQSEIIPTWEEVGVLNNHTCRGQRQWQGKERKGMHNNNAFAVQPSIT